MKLFTVGTTNIPISGLGYIGRQDRGTEKNEVDELTKKVDLTILLVWEPDLDSSDGSI